MPTDDLTIQTWTADPVRVVRITGELYLPDVPKVMSALTRALVGGGRRPVVCDVSDLAVPMSDALLTAFPAALRRAGGWPHAALHLAAPNPGLEERCRRLRMQRYLPLHSSLGDALRQARLDIVSDQVEVTLTADDANLAAARDLVREVWPATASQGREEAVLVANELTANAIRHVARPFTVVVAVGPEHLLVAVTDPSRHEPVLRPPRRSTPGGRGLQVVAGLSQDWGVRLVHREGKTVWARVPAPAGRPPRPRAPSALDA